MPGGVRTEIHLGGPDTNGAFCLLIDEPPGGWSLPPHLHQGVAETIHVVAGEFWMEVEGKRSILGAGETIHIPGDTVHSGGNLGETPGRRVVIFTPGGMERFFLEAGTSSAEAQVDLAGALAAAQRHGWKFLS